MCEVKGREKLEKKQLNTLPIPGLFVGMQGARYGKKFQRKKQQMA